MKITVTKEMFIQAFHDSQTYQNTFSYEGLSALYDYLIGIEEELGEEIELDVQALCGQFHEYRNIHQFNKDFGTNYTNHEEISDLFVIPVEENGHFIVEL